MAWCRAAAFAGRSQRLALVKSGLLRTTNRLWAHLERRRRRQLGVLGLLMLLSAVLEVASLGALLPFLALLSSPDRILTSPMLAGMLSRVGMATADQLVLPFAVLFAVVVIVAAMVRFLMTWSSVRLAYAISGDFGIEIYRRTLYQPYRVHISRNSSAVLSGITYNVDAAMRMLIAELNLAAGGVILLAVAAVLLAVHPLAASLAGIGFASSYLFASWITRGRLILNGASIAREQKNIIQLVQEGLGGIREVLLDWTQPVYVDLYRKASMRVRRAWANHQSFAGAPRLVMEAVGIVFFVGLVMWLSSGDGLAAALPVLGVLALGAQRLLPVMQQAYVAWTTIALNIVPVNDALDMLDQPLPPEASQPPPSPLILRHGIRFDGVRFRYTAEAPWVLDGVNLLIPKGMRIGIVGGTGTGKSTLLDLLTGLLEATEGSILVDELSISDERLRAWQRTVAHVPQNIYLADASIAENIAFGTPPEAIDLGRVTQAATEAQIASFVEGLPNRYSTTIGERGVRLSGGQRQRVGIARALYKRGSVLVFDEATSALDNITEQSVMGTIEGLDRELTIIIIAHRLSTMRRCDRFIELIDGRAVQYGSYEDMLLRSPSAGRVERTAPVGVMSGAVTPGTTDR